MDFWINTCDVSAALKIENVYMNQRELRLRFRSKELYTKRCMVVVGAVAGVAKTFEIQLTFMHGEV